MIGKMTQTKFRENIIAQADSGGYDPGGWLAYVDGDNAALAHFGHCSCYGTFEAVCGGGISDYFEDGTPAWDWQGTPDELVALARGNADPEMTGRTLSNEDYDAGFLQQVYAKVLEWDAAGRPVGGVKV